MCALCCILARRQRLIRSVLSAASERSEFVVGIMYCVNEAANSNMATLRCGILPLTKPQSDYEANVPDNILQLTSGQTLVGEDNSAEGLHPCHMQLPPMSH